MKRFLTIALLFLACHVFAQDGSRPAPGQPSNPPLYIIDGKVADSKALTNLDPNTIASVMVLKDANATAIYGSRGQFGVILIESKQHARNIYWTFFRSKSPAYTVAVPDPAKDSTVVYIVNGKVLGNGYESDLAKIDEKTFLEMKVIDKNALKKEYGITGRTHGIVIKKKTDAAL